MNDIWHSLNKLIYRCSSAWKSCIFHLYHVNRAVYIFFTSIGTRMTRLSMTRLSITRITRLSMTLEFPREIHLVLKAIWVKLLYSKLLCNICLIIFIDVFPFIQSYFFLLSSITINWTYSNKLIFTNLKEQNLKKLILHASGLNSVVNMGGVGRVGCVSQKKMHGRRGCMSP